MIHTIYIMYTNQLLIEGYTYIQLIYRKFEASQGWKASGDPSYVEWCVQNLCHWMRISWLDINRRAMGDVPRREVEPQSREVKHQRIRMLLSIKDDVFFSCWQIWPAIWMSINEFLMSKRPSWAPPHCYNLSRSVSIYIHWCSFSTIYPSRVPLSHDKTIDCLIT